MKHVVFEEMFQAAGGRIPQDPEACTRLAHQSWELAVVLPFYMYYFHPNKWKEYTLFTDDPLPSTLNHAAHIALDAPTLHAGKQIKRYFYRAASITSIPGDYQTAMSVANWTYYLFRKYHQICERARVSTTVSK